MKLYPILFLLVLSPLLVFSQEPTKPDSLEIANSVFTEVPNMPLFADAKTKEESDALVFSYLANKVKESKTKEKGNVYLSFTINKDGVPGSIIIRKAPSKTLSDLAEQFILEMPGWTPGSIHGQNTNVQLTVPIMFR